MELPRFYYLNEYSTFEAQLKNLPHMDRHFQKGEYLWKEDAFITECSYIQSGIAKMFCLHENGHQRILDFHSTGDITPGFHETQFKIEKSICIEAVTDVQAMVFSRKTLHDYCEKNTSFSNRLIEVYAKYINNLIYQCCHQEYNDVFLKLCNLLYLFYRNSGSRKIPLSQEDMADILAVNRVNISKALSVLKDSCTVQSHHGWIEVLNPDQLAKYCSMETQI